MERTSIENVRVQTPCPKKWAELTGGEEKRYCDDCQLHVINLSALTRKQGELALEEARETQGRVCATYKSDADGAVVSRMSRLQEVGVFLRRGVGIAASFAVGALSLAGFSGCSQATDIRCEIQPVPVDDSVLLGGIEAPSSPDAVDGPGGCEVPAPDEQIMGRMVNIEMMGEVMLEDEPER